MSYEKDEKKESSIVEFPDTEIGRLLNEVQGALVELEEAHQEMMRSIEKAKEKFFKETSGVLSGVVKNGALSWNELNDLLKLEKGIYVYNIDRRHKRFIPVTEGKISLKYGKIVCLASEYKLIKKLMGSDPISVENRSDLFDKEKKLYISLDKKDGSSLYFVSLRPIVERRRPKKLEDLEKRLRHSSGKNGNVFKRKIYKDILTVSALRWVAKKSFAFDENRMMSKKFFDESMRELPFGSFLLRYGKEMVEEIVYKAESIEKKPCSLDDLFDLYRNTLRFLAPFLFGEDMEFKDVKCSEHLIDGKKEIYLVAFFCKDEDVFSIPLGNKELSQPWCGRLAKLGENFICEVYEEVVFNDPVALFLRMSGRLNRKKDNVAKSMSKNEEKANDVVETFDDVIKGNAKRILYEFLNFFFDFKDPKSCDSSIGFDLRENFVELMKRKTGLIENDELVELEVCKLNEDRFVSIELTLFVFYRMVSFLVYQLLKAMQGFYLEEKKSYKKSVYRKLNKYYPYKEAIDSALLDKAPEEMEEERNEVEKKVVFFHSVVLEQPDRGSRFKLWNERYASIYEWVDEWLEEVRKKAVETKRETIR